MNDIQVVDLIFQYGGISCGGYNQLQAEGFGGCQSFFRAVLFFSLSGFFLICIHGNHQGMVLHGQIEEWGCRNGDHPHTKEACDYVSVSHFNWLGNKDKRVGDFYC